ncbi:MAG: hypothetical protein ACHQ51_04620 [Elusimicrobiota bacterium]
MRYPLRRLAVALPAFLLCVRAYAWEAKAGKVEKRLRELSSFTSGGQSGPAVQRVLRGSRHARKPAWAKKSAGADGRVHWSEKFGGKTYYFGVGALQNVKNPSLQADAAEEQARVSLAYALGAPGADGKISADLSGSRILDWYLNPKGELSALAVIVKE